MTLDIKGGLKNTDASTNRYVVFEELLSNAIDSYLIRKNSDPKTPALFIEFQINIFPYSMLENGECDVKISCTDNGAGFGDEQVKAFVTKDSTYKDYLNIQGIDKCKGVGRIQFFHFFKQLKINSIYSTDKSLKYRSLSIFENSREVSEDQFKTENSLENEKIETTVTLQSLKDEYVKEELNLLNVRNDFSAKAVKNSILITFLQRFIILKNIIGDFSISILQTENGSSEKATINSKDLPQPIERKKISLISTSGNQTENKNNQLEITRYSLPYESFRDSRHEIALCANSALVRSLTKKFLKKSQYWGQPIEDHFELILIESEILEKTVNERRDGFNLPEECSSNEDIEGGISIQDIVESIEDYIYEILTPKDFDKEKMISSTQEKYGISKSMLENTNTKVHYSDTEENLAKRVLRKYQDEIVRETSQIFNLKQQLLELDPRSNDFREKIGELSWKYTTTIKKMDMANLSQLVVRRSSIIEVLKMATKSMLDCQDTGKEIKQNEKIIHNIFFPTGKDSNDSIDHDIWILNEEYHYFDHIASDKSLATIPWNENEKLFDHDIDSNLEELFAKNNKDHRLKRPDIAIFNQEGAAIIIEFKAPGVELQEHIPDLAQYARLLSAKSNGKIKKIYGYLIGDKLDENRMPLNYTMFPSGLGFFNTERISEPKTGTQYGELYSEILFYDQFIDRAEQRLKVYKEKLNVTV